MNHPYLPILVVLIMAMGFAGTFLGLSAIIGPKKFTKNKRSPYECGLDPVGGARDRVSVKFFLVAILFILFDVEVVFLIPWAVLYKSFIAEGMGLFMFVEMMIFVATLVLGLAFVWRKGALEWR